MKPSTGPGRADAAIPHGFLHYRLNSIFGDPFLRLLWREVEALVKKNHGDGYVKERQARMELTRINRELKGLKARSPRWKSGSRS